MLRSLIGYVRGAGLDGRWVVADGDPEFFHITKRLHNRLHGFAGDGGPLGDAERAAYEHRCEVNARRLAESVRPGDVVILHDPQTAGMLPALRAACDVPLIWRAHIGLDLPNDLAREAWRFLLPYVQEADAHVFSREAFAWEGLEPSRLMVIPPSIDAFAPKNQGMSYTSVTAVLRAAGLARQPRRPAPRGVRAARRERRLRPPPCRNARGGSAPARRPAARAGLAVGPPQGSARRAGRFAEHVRAAESPHLLLAGPDVRAVADDPEGAEVLAEVEAAWHELPRAVRRRVHLAMLPMEDAEENAIIVNALQRRADVVAQKSLAEGFGLTVAEAMWKGRPVVATTVGGIQDQIEDGRTGYLVEPRDLRQFGERVSTLLERYAQCRADGRGGAAARARPVPRAAASRSVRGPAAARTYRYRGAAIPRFGLDRRRVASALRWPARRPRTPQARSRRTRPSGSTIRRPRGRRRHELPRHRRPGAGRPDRPRDGHRRARARRRARRLAMEETGFGVFEDKVVKNYIATEFLYDYLKDKRSVGVIEEDAERAISYVAEPIGVVLALTPITNPTSTALFKAIVAAKTRNAMIFRPSARAARCAQRAIELLQAAGEAAGLPPDALQVIPDPTLDVSQYLFHHPGVDFIWTTGGPKAVAAANAAGKPCISVGAGQRARSTCTAAPTSGWPPSTC